MYMEGVCILFLLPKPFIHVLSWLKQIQSLLRTLILSFSSLFFFYCSIRYSPGFLNARMFHTEQIYTTVSFVRFKKFRESKGRLFGKVARVAHSCGFSLPLWKTSPPCVSSWGFVDFEIFRIELRRQKLSRSRVSTCFFHPIFACLYTCQRKNSKIQNYRPCTSFILLDDSFPSL